MSKYTETGKYESFNQSKVLKIEKDIFKAMEELRKEGFTNVQGTDFMDALVAVKVGYDKRNVRSNDFDAKNSKTKRYLENKRVSGVTKGLYAKFPDLNRDGVKLDELKRGVLITVSNCPSSHTLEYFLVLNSADIYDVIEEKFNEAKTKNRSNVRIPLKDLLFKGHASIVANTTFFTKNEVCEDIKQKSKRYFGKINPKFIYTLKDVNWVIRQHMEYADMDDSTIEKSIEKGKLFKTEDFLVCTSREYQKKTGTFPTNEFLAEMLG